MIYYGSVRHGRTGAANSSEDSVIDVFCCSITKHTKRKHTGACEAYAVVTVTLGLAQAPAASQFSRQVTQLEGWLFKRIKRKEDGAGVVARRPWGSAGQFWIAD